MGTTLYIATQQRNMLITLVQDKNVLSFIPYDERNEESPSEVKTYQLELEECYSIGKLSKSLEYVTVLCFCIFANIYSKEIWRTRLTF